MDPVAHTLFGATLAETGLRKLSRLATPTLIIGANLPDIDAVVTVLGQDTSLLLRRGMTHGVVAMVGLPLLLAGGMWLWDRRKAAPEGAPPFRLGAIVGLSFLGVWSHPFLDWMNTYGVRLLMPFDGRWFYGDTLFIMDPWFWLLSGAGVVLARSNSRKSIAGWVLLATLATLLVMLFPTVPVGAKILWAVGVAVVVALRRIRRSEALPRNVARAGLATLVLYIGAVYGLARVAESAASSGETALLEVQSNPIPALPHRHRVVLVYEDRYRVVPQEGEPFDVPRSAPDEVVQAALKAPQIRGFVNWMRFPYWEKQPHPAGGWLVTIRDLRYVDPGELSGGIGLAQVRLDEYLQPID